MNDYYCVGSISEEVSKESGIPAGDIVINQDRLEYIQTEHCRELGKLGINAFDYVCLVADSFDTVVDNNNGSYKLLISIYHHSSDTFCMIELTKLRSGISYKWLVTTSQPQRKPFSPGGLGKVIIWKRKR